MNASATPLAVKQPFTYIAATPSIAAFGSATVTLILDNDSDFDLQAILASTSGDTTLAALANNFTLRLKDASGGRYFSSAPVPRFLLAGIVPQNVLNEGLCIRFPKKNQLELEVVNTTAAPLIVTIGLKGYKAFSSVL